MELKLISKSLNQKAILQRLKILLIIYFFCRSVTTQVVALMELRKNKWGFSNTVKIIKYFILYFF